MNEFITSDFETVIPRKRDNLFLWTVLILLLIGFALACWLGSFYVFGHPERPESYKILQKLHKIEPPKRFELTAAPPGEFLSPQKLFERYNTYSRLQLQNENDALMRDYIGNYSATKKLVPYVVGRFTILDSYELKPSDLFPSGVVALAQSADFAQMMIEHVYTAEPVNVPALRKMLQTGLDMKLEKSLDLAAVIHIERLFNGSLQFTVVPLLYGTYALKQGTGTFSLEPPPRLNLETGAPIVRGVLLQDAMKTFAEYKQKNSPIPSALEQAVATPSATPSNAAELVRVETPAEAEATPAPRSASISPNKPGSKNAARPVATPAPATRALPVAPIAAAHTQPAPPALAMNNNAPPVTVTRDSPPTAPAVPAVPAEPATAQNSNSATGVPLQPFLGSAPAPRMVANGATWRTYRPGQMPSGRVLDPDEAAQLADSGVGSERIYLRGQFVVTASGENRAVLRSQRGVLGSLLKPGGAVPTRVIVEFPAGSTPPPENSTFARDDTRPFQITDVRRGADGQINVYVREVTAP